MRCLHFAVLCCFLTVASPARARLQIVAVSPDEATSWSRHVVPLPHELTIHRKVVVAPGEVAVVAPADSSPVVEQAAQNLRKVLGSAVGNSFTLTLQLGGAEAESLRTLPNSSQAYRIFPEANDKGLRLVALDPRGLYYAAKTLEQFIRARATKERVEIPVLSVVDYPDMEDRGLWGSDSFLWLEWMAERKMNVDEQISALSVDPQTKRGRAAPKPGYETIVTVGPRHAVQPVPVILHLEQLSGKGVFEAYPSLRAQGGQEGAICYSKPEFVGVLADWIVDLRHLPGVKDVDIWLAENLHGQGGCRCAECRKVDRSVLELRTILAAWRLAKQKVGDVGLRVLTSEETYPSHALMFRELPPDVKLWYYHSLFTYNTGESPMITGEVEKLASGKHWVGVCPNLNANVGRANPFTGAQFIHYQMNEFVSKNVKGLIGYATPRVRYARFNVEAAAEWSWNAKGRTPHEFALSWAVRQGIRNPQKFAEWSDTLGPVAWDVYGSDFPAGDVRRVPGAVAENLRKGKLPELGTVTYGVFRAPWGDIKSAEQLNNDVTAAARAVVLAREMGESEFIQESLVVQGYVNTLKSLYELKQFVTPQGIAPENREAAKRYFQTYLDSLKQSATALPEWESTIAPKSGKERFTGRTVELLQNMTKQMEETAVGLGVGVDAQ